MDKIAKTSERMNYSSAPPIITQSGETGTEELQTYLATLSGTPDEIIAEKEGERLSEYFSAMEQRLEPASLFSNVTDPLNIITYKKSNLPHSDQEQGLSLIFRTIAADTGNIILSQFGLAPASILPNEISGNPALNDLQRTGKISSFFTPAHFGMGDFLVTTHFSLGFIQVLKRSSNSSVSFPMMGIDDRIMADTVSHEGAAELFEALSAVATQSNHDMLHHITSPALNDSITSHTKRAHYGRQLHNFIDDHLHARNEDDDTNPESYESWALISHSISWRQLSGSQTERDLELSVEQYFNALDNIVTSLSKTKTPEECHEIADYYSTALGYVLLRIIPIDAPLMQYALARMESADPLPEKTIALKAFEKIEDTQNLPIGELKQLYLEHLDSPGFVTGNLRYMAGETLESYNAFIKARDRSDSACIDKEFITNLMYGDEEKRKPSLPLLTFLASDEILTVPEPHTLQDGNETLKDAYTDAPAQAADRIKSMTSNLKRYNKRMVEAITEALQVYASSIDQNHQNESVRLLKRMTRLHLDNLRKRIDALSSQETDHTESMQLKTLRNYRQAGKDLIGTKGEPTYKVAKILQLLSISPEIPYLNSPACSDQQLPDARATAQIVDQGVINLIANAIKNCPA